MSNGSLTLPKLTVLVAVLGLAVLLAASNPTTADYVSFLRDRLQLALEQRLESLDKTLPAEQQELIRTVVRAQGRRLLDRVLRPNTVRRNFGMFSLFETNALEARVVVLGIGTRFVPLSGIEEAAVKVGQMSFSAGF